METKKRPSRIVEARNNNETSVACFGSFQNPHASRVLVLEQAGKAKLRYADCPDCGARHVSWMSGKGKK